MPITTTQKSSVSQAHDGTRALCEWIEANLQGFSPHGPADAPFERYKAIGELSMALFALSHPASRLTGWARTMAARLSAILRIEADEIDWARFHEESSASRFHAASLVPFVLIRNLTGTPIRPEIADIGKNAPDGLMDSYLLRTLLELPADATPLVLCLTQILSALDASSHLGRPSLYDLTHAVFYLTLFGRRTQAVPADLAEGLCAHLRLLAHARIKKSDHDLAGELLVAHAYLGGTRNASIADAYDELREAVRPDGSVAGPPWLQIPGFSPFESSYHTTLVVLMALGLGA